MANSYNELVFTPEDIEDGLLDDAIKYLLDHNKKSNRAYYDIHITSDGYCTIVEWVSVPYEDEHYNGEFVFKDEDEYIMKEVILPDNSIEYVFPGDEKETIKEWLENNPGWHKRDGMWIYDKEIN